ncbi:MAG: hypothetical protein KG028_10990 [Actinobacteria bacterium]|jgi:hypothetical protein|nr:hypothetical protein [Actinomycetota bacterium]
MTSTMSRANSSDGGPRFGLEPATAAAATPRFLSARLNEWWLRRLRPAGRPTTPTR